MDKSFEKRLNALEEILKKHEPAIGFYRKKETHIEIDVDGKTLTFDTSIEADKYMDMLPGTTFVILERVKA